ncbi:MAG: hypothetical protein RL329_1790 [Bacteroidota bacterium]
MLKPILYYQYIKNDLRQQPFAKYHFYIFCFLISVAVTAPFIAKQPTMTQFLPPLIPYDAMTTHLSDKLLSPFDNQPHLSWYRRHWLGTDGMGRDIAAGLVAGTRIALQVGLSSVALAAVIGLFAGLMSGYYGDERFRMPRRCVILWILGWTIWGFYIHVFAQQEWAFTQFYTTALIFTMLLISVLHILEKMIMNIKHQALIWIVPIDYLVMRSIDFLQAIPFLIILLGLMPFIKQKSVSNVILIIGCVTWMPIARLIRAQVIRLRTRVFIQNAEALGYPTWRIWAFHLIPNLLTPLLVAMSFGVANAIMAEGLLSFLGVGLPDDLVTWGSICQAARANATHWWLVLFPSGAILLTVLIFNWLGEHLKQLK